ncbi:MAG: iron-sulfur cluster assembly scaffold protein [bacterium]|nr:iron-sulfur cluster assembly scaffold protein [bacterium]
MDKELKREIILDNYNNPFNRGIPSDDSYIMINTNNESCIDNLDIYFKINEGKIVDVYFDGEACAISTSATSIINRIILNKTKDEIKEIIDNYKNMINELSYDKEVLKDLIVYDDIYLQPNRKTCALLPVKAIEKILEKM